MAVCICNFRGRGQKWADPWSCWLASLAKHGELQVQWDSTTKLRWRAIRKTWKPGPPHTHAHRVMHTHLHICTHIYLYACLCIYIICICLHIQNDYGHSTYLQLSNNSVAFSIKGVLRPYLLWAPNLWVIWFKGFGCSAYPEVYSPQTPGDIILS